MSVTSSSEGVDDPAARLRDPPYDLDRPVAGSELNSIGVARRPRRLAAPGERNGGDLGRLPSGV